MKITIDPPTHPRSSEGPPTSLSPRGVRRGTSYAQNPLRRERARDPPNRAGIYAANGGPMAGMFRGLSRVLAAHNAGYGRLLTPNVAPIGGRIR
jgi:hypothetical protein